MRYGTPQLARFIVLPFILALVAGNAAHAESIGEETTAQSAGAQSGKSISDEKSSTTQATDARPKAQSNDGEAAREPAAAAKLSSPTSTAKSEPNPEAAGAQGGKSKSFFVFAGDVIGKRVRDNARDGQFVGELGSLVVDTTNGRTDYAIIDRGGFLGFGQTHVVVPFEFVDFPGQQGFPILKISASKLDDAPQVSDRDLESLLHDPEWRRSVADYYGLSATGDKPKVATSTATSTKDAASTGAEAAIAHGP